MLEVWVALLWVASLAHHVRVEGATSQADVSTLNVLYKSLNSPSQLTGWSSDGGDPCGQSWKGVTCSGSDVTEVVLSNLGLNGSMGYKLADMVSLLNFDVSKNNIGAGGQLPYGLPPNLHKLDLSENQFGGTLPYSISQMSSLTYLNLGHNNLQGILNNMFSNHTKLLTMDLSFNNFSGTLPQSFSTLSSLSSLLLQNNQFAGSLDVLVNLSLVNLNIMHNKFNGTIPDKLKLIKNFRSDNISWGSPVSSPSSHRSPSSHETNPGQRSSGNTGLPAGRGRDKSGIGTAGIAGIIVAGLVVGSLLAFFLVKKKQKATTKKKTLKIDRPHVHIPYEDDVEEETKPSQKFLQTDAVALQTVPSLPSLKPPPIDQQKSFSEDDDSKNAPMSKNYQSVANATSYSVADLQLATGSFNSENLVGEGSFGRVYRAQFEDGRVVAVKKVNSSALPNQTAEYFLEMVSRLSQMRHPNVIELVGYCCEHGQHLLVFEFQKNGSLQDLLHLSDEYSKPLTWNSRIKIALGTARALEYLHEVCSPSVVHKNFKSANILLDHELNPHLSDCGFSNFVINTECQASDRSMGFGYSAPEVVMSGQYTLKSDVYSFGVVMLELLTARKPFDSLRTRAEQSLVRWATPQLHDIDALDKMVDPALKGLYAAKSLSRFADIIALCVQSEPEFRPPMSEVVQALVRLVQRANMSRRMGSADEMETPRRVEDVEKNDVF